ncbi:amidohydrolase [Pacificimonas flava]|uniref:Amidohydrolase n=2 Tax=Pacificimonas TaxID=1960290 RepID=A0A219B511_9SPHN|nr:MULTISPECIES: amidohydrolase [Pacificimonas]MBZ6379326.1 amidohydrolase [Pacificimonas aurantium]OWV33470.1 amidohydrolase [Pacificimonas flava]
MTKKFAPAALAALFAVSAPALAANEQIALDRIEADRDRNVEVASTIWGLAELGYQETKSSELLQDRLAAAGFEINAGVAGAPTAFTATYSTGDGPVIGIMGEFDALPGFSQAAEPAKQTVANLDAGHACGHHMFGTASASAAIAVKDWLTETGTPGTVRFYGTPAEEGGAGKVYMVREGLFDDVDVALHWHPGAQNSADIATSNSNKSGKFRFYGKSAHAAAAPEQGRSALDGVEAMDMMANMMREHMPQESRMHYVITAGGRAPNVVPDFAEVFYYVRNPDAEVVRETFERLVKVAEGAALGTETRMDYEVIHGAMPLLPNETLQQLVHEKMTQVGGVDYEAAELAFAQELKPTLANPDVPMSEATGIDPLSEDHGAGSTDVGDVSWAVPTAGFNTATWVPGTPAHSWQAVAAGGMSIGWKGMQNAAKILALTAIDLYEDPAKIAAAKEEFLSRKPEGYEYRALLGDREPPLDYRD